MTEPTEKKSKWKLPRLSDPTVTRVGDLEITQASTFDCMSTRAQWVVVVVATIPMIALLVCLYLQHKGILK